MDKIDATTGFRSATGRQLPDCRRLPGCEDRRSFDRIRRSLPVSYRVTGLRWTRSRILSLSATGARVLLYEPVSPGQKVHLRLEISRDWQPQVHGRPVWTQDLGDKACIVGLHFEPLRPEDEDRLRLWVRRELLNDVLGHA